MRVAAKRRREAPEVRKRQIMEAAKRCFRSLGFQASTVERWHPVDARTIHVDVTVYDPASLEKPYKAAFVFGKVDQPTWVNFSSCEQGNNAVRTADGSTSFVLPGEAGYHDPDTFGIPDVAFDTLPK